MVAVGGVPPSAVPPGAIPRSSCDGPAQARWRTWPLEAGLLRHVLRLRAEHAPTSYVRMIRGSGVMVDLPPSRRAMRHARTLGQRKARARQAGTARPAIAHAASRTPRFYRALCADDGPWRTRALRQPPPRPAVSADPVGRRAPPVRSNRLPKLVTFVAKKNIPPLYGCVRNARTHKWRVLTHTPLSNRERGADTGRWSSQKPLLEQIQRTWWLQPASPITNPQNLVLLSSSKNMIKVVVLADSQCSVPLHGGNGGPIAHGGRGW